MMMSLGVCKQLGGVRVSAMRCERWRDERKQPSVKERILEQKKSLSVAVSHPQTQYIYWSYRKMGRNGGGVSPPLPAANSRPRAHMLTRSPSPRPPSTSSICISR